MALSEEMRHRIYTRLEEVMGGEETAALMAQFPLVAWAEVATKTDLDHSTDLVRGDIARLDGRIDQVSEVLQGRIDQVSEVLRGDIARVDARIDQVSEVLRGDIARVDARIDQVSEVLRGDIARVDARIDQVSEVLRGDIARLDEVFEARLGAEVARGIGETRATLRSLILGLVALQVSAAGLVLAVSRLV